MPKFKEQRHVPYSAQQMFDLVGDVERYPEFLPWCAALRITRRDGEMLHADMVIGFKMLREKFSTRARLQSPSRIDVEYLNGPFKYLQSHWVFTDKDQGDGCTIDFHIDFEFSSRLFQTLIGAVFTEAAQRLVASFETRAHSLYGQAEGRGERGELNR